jgi:hypothetical protein
VDDEFLRSLDEEPVDALRVPKICDADIEHGRAKS